MVGRGRVLRSVGEPVSASAAFAYARAGAGRSPAPAQGSPASGSSLAYVAPPRARPERFGALRRFLGHPLVTVVFVFGTLGASVSWSLGRSGEYDKFIHEIGTPGDLLARALGMGVRTVQISGLSELKEQEVLDYAGVKARNSLPFLDADAMRRRLLATPAIRAAQVRKFYPDRLAISIVERRPHALWQRDGAFQVIAEDGMPLGPLTDRRFADLPLVVGEKANDRIGEYRAILAAAGESASQVKSGVLVSQRRWSLFLQNGVEIRLPEENPEAAMALLAKLQRERRLFDKDVSVIDARVPGRLELRLPEDVAARKFDPAVRAGKGKA